MAIEIRDLDKKDYEIVRQFAIEGMDIRRYSSIPYEIYLYSKFFFYLELLRATQILAAYDEDKLVGVLFVEIKGEPTKVNSLWYKGIVKSIGMLMPLMFNGQSLLYDEANEAMFAEYTKTNKPDGELVFFAVDPTLQGKGIGTLLLQELEKREKGKEIYLYTDSGCNVEFYNHKNFVKEQVRDITMVFRDRVTPLTCYLFSKVL